MLGCWCAKTLRVRACGRVARFGTRGPSLAPRADLEALGALGVDLGARSIALQAPAGHRRPCPSPARTGPRPGISTSRGPVSCLRTQPLEPSVYIGGRGSLPLTSERRPWPHNGGSIEARGRRVSEVGTGNGHEVAIVQSDRGVSGGKPVDGRPGLQRTDRDRGGGRRGPRRGQRRSTRP